MSVSKLSGGCLGLNTVPETARGPSLRTASSPVLSDAKEACVWKITNFNDNEQKHILEKLHSVKKY